MMDDLSAILVILGAVTVAAAWLAHRFAPVPRRRRQDRTLTEHRRELERRARESHRLLDERRTLIGELRELGEMMRRTDARRYAHRLERVDASITALERQVEVERMLLEEYERADRMLEVEIETLRVVGRLEDGTVEEITARIAELEAMREANRESGELIAANEEIERYLEGRS